MLNALLENQSLSAYGLTLGAGAQFAPGSMHPALTRLEKLGWVESWWHDRASRPDIRRTVRVIPKLVDFDQYRNDSCRPVTATCTIGTGWLVDAS